MKHIKPISEFLNEGKQVGNLYHYTSFDFLIGILETNSLIGSKYFDSHFVFDNDELSEYPLTKEIEGIELEKLNNYYKNQKDKFLNFYNVSLTRNPLFHKFRSDNIHKHCRIKLDGNKLSNHYEIVPYQHLANYGKSIDGVGDEDEEVLIIKNGNSIKNIKDYIISIDFPYKKDLLDKLYVEKFIGYLNRKCKIEELATPHILGGSRYWNYYPNYYIDILNQNNEKINNILDVNLIFPNP